MGRDGATRVGQPAADHLISRRGPPFGTRRYPASGVKERRGSPYGPCLPVDRHRLAGQGAVPLPDLWWRYVGLGGGHPRAALAGYLNGGAAWADAEHNVLAQTLNEGLWDVGVPSLAPHREPLAAVRTGHGRRIPLRCR